MVGDGISNWSSLSHPPVQQWSYPTVPQGTELLLSARDEKVNTIAALYFLFSPLCGNWMDFGVPHIPLGRADWACHSVLISWIYGNVSAPCILSCWNHKTLMVTSATSVLFGVEIRKRLKGWNVVGELLVCSVVQCSHCCGFVNDQFGKCTLLRHWERGDELTSSKEAKWKDQRQLYFKI